MNILKSSLRVKLGLSNPYDIKPEFKMFQKPKDNQLTAKLLDRHQINYDSYILTFQLPEENKCLGIKNGEYVSIELNGDSRNYVPISPIDQPETVDFLIRDRRKEQKGSFTASLLELNKNDEVKIRGPESSYIYHGRGKIQYALDTDKLEEKVTKKFKNIGVITHASGITTSYSMIQSIALNYDNSTGISLLWLGDTEEDFMFIDQFAGYVQQTKINVNLMLTKFEKGWLGPYGKITKQHIKSYIPSPGEQTFVLMSALEGDLSQIRDVVSDMGHKNVLYA